MLIDDEDDLRTALRDATGPQPPLSGALAERAARRSAAVRHRRVALAAVATAAVVAAVPAIQVAQRTPEPKFLAASLLTWPDGRENGWEAAADMARHEAERMDQALHPEGTRVRWLYAGPARGVDQVVVAWAYCGPDACTRVVLAHSDTDVATSPVTSADSTSWLSRYGDVAADTPIAAISGYLEGPKGAHGVTNVLVAVAPPKAKAVRWSSPARLPGTGGSGDMVKQGGAYYASIGYLSADPTLTVTLPHGTRSATLGVPGAAEPEHGRPLLPDEPVLPPGYERSFSAPGPAEGVGINDQSPHGRRISVFAVCDDPGVRVLFEYEERQYPVPCDGTTHAAFLDLPVHGGVTWVQQTGPSHPYTGLWWVTAYRP